VQLLFAIFFVLLGIGVVLNVLQRGRAAQFSPNATAGTPIPYLYPEVLPTTIVRIAVEDKRAGRRFTLTKIPGNWQAEGVEGQSLKVDLTKLPTILQLLSTLRYNRSIDLTDQESFGLAEGGWFVIRFEAGRSSYTLHIGDNNPDQTLAYVRRGDAGPALAVSAIQAQALVSALQSSVSAPIG
jgi:hypothetical protein